MFTFIFLFGLLFTVPNVVRARILAPSAGHSTVRQLSDRRRARAGRHHSPGVRP